MKSLKILQVYKTCLSQSMGGVERVIDTIARNTSTDFQHTLITLTHGSKDSKLISNTVPILSYHENFSIASNSVSWDLFRDFNKIIQDFDIIHYHFPWPFADLLHWLNKVNKPSIITYHSDIVRQKKWLFLYKPLMHRFLEQIKVIVATSPNYLASSPILQQYRKKVTVIPIGIHNDIRSISSDKDTYWKTRLGERFFLFVGVLRYYKGLHILLQAAKIHGYPIVIVGSGDKKQQQALINQAQQLQLKKVFFLGHVSEEDKLVLQRLCLAVVFPSHLRSEAFGISLLEGAMVGKPLISTDINTGTSYINVHNQTGLIVPPNDVPALSNAMHYLWNNPFVAVRMGEQAHKRYLELFTVETMRQKYEHLYLNVYNLGSKDCSQK